jgi:bis(5'-nucleosyl)-tetraphosphatase (symmetrical)
MRNLVGAAATPECELQGEPAPAWQPSSKAHEGVAWASAWRPDEGTLPGVDHVVFGHDAKRGLQQHEHATGLDSGACYGKALSALILPDRRVVAVPSMKVYAQPGS